MHRLQRINTLQADSEFCLESYLDGHQVDVDLVLYKGVNIFGYAHVQLWPKNRKAIRAFIQKVLQQF